MRNRAFWLAPLVFSIACGSDGPSLTSPSNSIPNVTGNYSGTTSLSFPELGQNLSCATTTSVTQSGSTVSIAPLQLGSPCSISVPVGNATIDATGSLGSSTMTDTESCGVYNMTGSGGFFGKDLRLSINATSRTCYNFNMTVNLSRR